ncbi:hypothetical protein H5410_002187 [Solanum commersonii]|uniref:Uncharacterized protein n=1 Tax=Solanum commersonii TaxID=4109 RepID=A0A9J6B165_SOLCO|nr:hypothetical protein H5410_002187 [Solanum commersonii]
MSGTVCKLPKRTLRSSVISRTIFYFLSGVIIRWCGHGLRTSRLVRLGCLVIFSRPGGRFGIRPCRMGRLGS